MKIISVVGARPNFMKIAPFVRAIEQYNGSISNANNSRLITHILVHTGQHYDECMSKSFFEALNIPHPDIDLEIGSGSHAEQVGRTMIEFEKVVRREKPDWIVVVGDVNATCACSIVAKKEHIKLAHIEAGLRSFDMKMPEEINRLVTDRLSDLLLTPDEISSQNLRNEGVPEDKIEFVGNIMIDTLEVHRETASKMDINQVISKNILHSDLNHDFNITATKFALMTLHRPSNVDKKEILEPIVNFLCDELSRDIQLLWTIHPRTRKQLQMFDLWDKVTSADNIILMNPIGYHEMLRLNMDAELVLTDSGGLQEECCVLGTPCMTMRWNTERPITLRKHGGSCVLVGNSIENLRKEYAVIKTIETKPKHPPLWDGSTAKHIVRVLTNKN